ncbi:MAG TPA: mitochondrial fission ELM1 family protein [Rhizomicrobium sp.]|nr:mitochondrial fission ELM1 family protein [Rhizomicrobium sp.]
MTSVDETWVVTEGIAGMENQCLGLAERLPLPIRTFHVALKPVWRLLAPHTIGSPLDHVTGSSDRLMPPWPRLLIGCGRQSIPFSLAVKAASGGATLTVQCQDPRIDPAKFDLVIPPEHDGLSGPTVFPIVGSPNRITPERLAAARTEFAPRFEPLPAPRVAVLLGGSSRTHGALDPAAAETLGALLRTVASGHGLMLSSSRRTPPASAEVIKRHLEGTGAFIWDGSGHNPYLGMLAWADAFVVTADSVNMICEAATTGKPVHVFSLPGGKRKAQLFQQSMAARGITRPFAGHVEQWSYVPLDETGRAAARIKSLLDARVPAPDING